MTKMDSGCKTRQLKTEESIKCWDICTYFIRGLTVLVWNRYSFPISKMVAFQTSNKKSGIKNVAIWVEILQLQRYTIAVIMKMRMRMNVSKIMRISKALRKKVYMLTSFYAGICTNFRYLKTMVSLKNTDLVTRELSKDFFS